MPNLGEGYTCNFGSVHLEYGFDTTSDSNRCQAAGLPNDAHQGGKAVLLQKNDDSQLTHARTHFLKSGSGFSLQEGSPTASTAMYMCPDSLSLVSDAGFSVSDTSAYLVHPAYVRIPVITK